jgi:hypothetical protein
MPGMNHPPNAPSTTTASSKRESRNSSSAPASSPSAAAEPVRKVHAIPEVTTRPALPYPAERLANRSSTGGRPMTTDMRLA